MGWSGGAWGRVGQGRGLGDFPLPFPSFQDNGLPAEGDKGLDGGPVESQPLAAAWRRGASPRMAPPQPPGPLVPITLHLCGREARRLCLVGHQSPPPDSGTQSLKDNIFLPPSLAPRVYFSFSLSSNTKCTYLEYKYVSVEMCPAEMSACGAQDGPVVGAGQVRLDGV